VPLFCLLFNRMKLIDIKKANDGIHKFVATFENEGRQKHIKFGAVGYSDYTIHKDPKRRERYLARHRGMGENWGKPDTPGALSRWILWEKPNFDDAVAEFRSRFGL